MEIIKLVMMETNGAVDIPSRPYELDVRSDLGASADELDRMTNGGSVINGSTVSRLASGILVPSTTTRHTNIENGWSESRIIFSMVIAVEDRGTYRDVRYISGYTDRNDYTVDSRGRVHFPDDMRLYFNSVTKISLLEVATRSGRGIRPTIRDNNLLLRRDSIVSSLNDSRRDSFSSRPLLVRPTDVLRRQGSQNYVNELMEGFDNPIAKNTIGKFVAKTTMSRRRNNNSAEHMSETINRYIDSRAGVEDNAGTNIYDNDMSDGASYLTEASTLSAETVLDQDPLFSDLRRISDIVDTGYIEWLELNRFDTEFFSEIDFPFISWKAQVKQSNRNRRDRGNMTRGSEKYNDTSSFYEVTIESTCALMIAQSIPELLSNAMYAGIQGLVLNTDPRPGEPKVHMALPTPFIDGIPVEQGYRYFTSQMENVILPNVSKNGLFQVEAMINASIDTDIEIWISVDGGPEEYFAWPTWAEALSAPVITDDERDLESISATVSGLIEDFAVKIENRKPRVMEVKNTREIFAGNRTVESLNMEPSSNSGRRYDNEIDLGF